MINPYVSFHPGHGSDANAALGGSAESVLRVNGGDQGNHTLRSGFNYRKRFKAPRNGPFVGAI